uniref:Uncharacterized protein n=1 Tax=Oryza brachyantha TaxID=4533 RepID=J3N7T9_ORYBR
MDDTRMNKNLIKWTFWWHLCGGGKKKRADGNIFLQWVGMVAWNLLMDALAVEGAAPCRGVQWSGDCPGAAACPGRYQQLSGTSTAFRMLKFLCAKLGLALAECIGPP